MTHRPIRAISLLSLLSACVDDPKPQPLFPPDDSGSGPTADSRPDSDTTTETVSTPPVPWLRDAREAPGSISFTEILYNAPSGADLEWIELHNPMVLDMDLSGWRLSGGVDFQFAAGTVLPAGSYLVVAADPTVVPGALGPYDGQLSDSGERLDLHNQTGRLIDTVGYADDDPWPVQADGSGLSLAKISADAPSDHAESWRGSAEIGGTPGQPNTLDPSAPPTTVELVPLVSTWAYTLSGEYPAADWADLSYDDSAWARGDAIFYAGGSTEDVPAIVRVTADNYYALYLGQADGADLRLVSPDSDGDWTTVDEGETWISPQDHLFLAAWEAPGDAGGPQMTIAEVELTDTWVGTNLTDFEWALGPTNGCPGTPDPPPIEADLQALILDNDTSGTWDSPAVEADRYADPWGWALGGAFAADTRYIWADTFGDTSITNTENTYALFRSRAPLSGPAGDTELSDIPTTTLFRSSFVSDSDPANTRLWLSCTLDDGAVIRLNGVEVHRENLDSGRIDSDTLASASVEDPVEIYTEILADALVRGTNVLAVELHQATPDDPDLRFGCALTARISAEIVTPTLVLNEVAPAAESPYWVELRNLSAVEQDTTGLILASAAGEQVLAAASVGAGGLVTVEDVEVVAEAGDVLFLYSADRSQLLDAVRVQNGVRGRDAAGEAWRVPSEPTPGEPNRIETTDTVVIHEIQYHRAPVSEDGVPVTDRPEEWIELLNRGADPVDLSGWTLVDAVTYRFPDGTSLAPGELLVVSNDAAALRVAYPGIRALGDWEGRLDNQQDRILLLDARGNPADEVRYFDGGRWPEAADGGGSSLELLDPHADNAAAEVWAPSDEAAGAAWTSYRWRAEATPSVVGPDGVWHELVLGLLDAGELLIDDLSVIQDPDANPVELVQNGTFDADTGHWRLLGNHRHSAVVPDPDDPSNSVLRLVATGPTGHMHNHAETTLTQPIGTREYEISFRARWVSGNNQLNTRLYFNRLPRTVRVPQSPTSGTPGAPNSSTLDNAGPTFSALRQDVVVPEPFESVWITTEVADPDGVATVTLWTSVEGEAFQATAMSQDSTGAWGAAVTGQDAGVIVQIYLEAEDTLGARASFPAAGADSRALLTFNDGEANTGGLHNLRLLLTAADSDWLHDDVNLMSDDQVGATVIYNESEVFYDVGLRAKGSERGRPEVARLGYGVSFSREQPFRGGHTSVLIDRSEGVGYGQREVLLNLVMTAAGSVSGEYNDLAHVLTPLPEHRGAAELQLDRFTSRVLDAQFVDGSAGALYEYELIYYPLTTDDGTAEGLKLPQPDSVVGTSVTDLGPDPEAWRWNFLMQNNEVEDNYDGILDLGQTFALSDAAFLAQAPAVIDVDQWLRAFAFATLSGAVDNYGSDNSQHNARFYVRPEDQRVLYFPHDLDFFGSSSMAVVGNSDLARLLQDPANLRAYYGHLNDIITRAYNPDYLAPWCAQLGALLPAQNFASHCQFIEDRADWVMEGASDAVLVRFPRSDFRITTEGGADFSVVGTEVELDGLAWVDVVEIQHDGAPLSVRWIDAQTWRVTLPIVAGDNELVLVALDHGGAVVGTDTVVVTGR